MTFTWHKPDGSQMTVENAQPLFDELDRLRAKHDALVASGDHKDAALVFADYQTVLEDWRHVQTNDWQQGALQLEGLVRMLRLRLAWWREMLEDRAPKTATSPAQQAIFADASDKPRTWEQACKAIDYLPDFRLPPPTQLKAAICKSVELQEQAKHFRAALLEAAKVLAAVDLSDAAALNRFEKQEWSALRHAQNAYLNMVRADNE